jgi:hypothetical protein
MCRMRLSMLSSLLLLLLLLLLLHAMSLLSLLFCIDLCAILRVSFLLAPFIDVLLRH